MGTAIRPSYCRDNVSTPMVSCPVKIDLRKDSMFGYDFDAMKVTSPPFIEKFNSVMHAIARPAYLLFPLLEKIFPRPHVRAEIASFKAAFDELIHARRGNRGHDLISFMLDDEGLSQDEIRENLITFFIASHVRVILCQFTRL
jgi:cytochrome P450